METIEIRNGTRSVISNNGNTAGVWESRLYVNDGDTATPTAAEHKTRKGAINWAQKVLGY